MYKKPDENPHVNAAELAYIEQDKDNEEDKKAKEAKAKAKELLASVGISEEQYKRYPANLSGGEQQRVAIARALSSGAKGYRLVRVGTDFTQSGTVYAQ